METRVIAADGKRGETNEKAHSKMVRTLGVESGAVGCALLDKAGNIWFGTGGEGVYRYNRKSFANFTTKDGLSDNHVSAIIEDRNGNILFGTKSGLCKFDGKSFARYADDTVLNESPITCLLEDREGNIWLGTLNSGVYRYDGRSVVNFLNKNGHRFNLGADHQLILDMLQDRNGNIWFCSWNRGGVWRFDGNTFTNFVPSLEYYRPKEKSAGNEWPFDNPSTQAGGLALFTGSLPQDSITDDMIFSVSEDRAGNLWFATRRHGACRYDGKKFTSLREAEGFVSRGIYSILEDKRGGIWLTTNDSGVWHYDGRSFKNFTTKDGLVNNSVYSALEDREGNMWFGTRGFGLSRYDGKAFQTFSE